MTSLSIRAVTILLASGLALAGSVAASTGPSLSIPDRIPGVFGTPVAVPIHFTGNDSQVSATIVSVDFDETCLWFEPEDVDPADGVPDDVLLTLPPQFTGSVSYDPEDTDGELDFVVADYGPPLTTLLDGVIVTIIFTPICEPDRISVVARVGFSQNPPVSFGDPNGQNIPGKSFDGSIEIGVPIFRDGFESGDLSSWSNH